MNQHQNKNFQMWRYCNRHQYREWYHFVERFRMKDLRQLAEFLHKNRKRRMTRAAKQLKIKYDDPLTILPHNTILTEKIRSFCYTQYVQYFKRRRYDLEN